MRRLLSNWRDIFMRFLEFPSSRHLRLPEHFQNSLPPRTAGDASFFRNGSGEGLSVSELLSWNSQQDKSGKSPKKKTGRSRKIGKGPKTTKKFRSAVGPCRKKALGKFILMEVESGHAVFHNSWTQNKLFLFGLVWFWGGVFLSLEVRRRPECISNRCLPKAFALWIFSFFGGGGFPVFPPFLLSFKYIYLGHLPCNLHRESPKKSEKVLICYSSWGPIFLETPRNPDN